MTRAMADIPLSYRRLLDLLHVRGEEDLKRGTQAATAALGFDMFLYGRLLPAVAPGTDETLYLLGTYPVAWLRRYAAERFDLIDPCARHGMRHAYPLPWTRDLFAAPEAETFYAEAAAYGVATGIEAPCVVGAASLGVARDDTLERSHADMLRALPWVNLLSGFVHGAVSNLTTPGEEEPPPLTRRERQCLERVAVGQRDAEIADGLRIAERTVLMHLANVRRKLMAQNRAQMIARGIKLGLIRP